MLGRGWRVVRAGHPMRNPSRARRVGGADRVEKRDRRLATGFFRAGRRQPLGASPQSSTACSCGVNAKNRGPTRRNPEALLDKPAVAPVSQAVAEH